MPVLLIVLAAVVTVAIALGGPGYYYWRGLREWRPNPPLWHLLGLWLGPLVVGWIITRRLGHAVFVGYLYGALVAVVVPLFVLALGYALKDSD